MRAKAVEFEVTYINLREKPDWFLAISPHGKVPVLDVDGSVLFESNAIAEFLDEVVPPRLHPEDPIKRARNRAWTDFVPDFSAALGGNNYASTPEKLEETRALARQRLGRLETAIVEERGNDGPYFNGPDISLVDAAYAPFFMRFAFVERERKSGLLDEFPNVRAWAETLLGDERVVGSVADNFPGEFVKMLHRRESLAAALFPLGEAAD